MKLLKSIIAEITAAVIVAVSVLSGFPAVLGNDNDSLCYIDFGASYAAGEDSLWKYYEAGTEGKVNVVDGRVEFSADTNVNNSSGNRSVLLANSISERKIASGGKYIVVFDLIASSDMFRNLSAQFIFANWNWAEIDGASKITNQISDLNVENQVTEGGNTVYTLSKVIAAPELESNCNLLLSIYGSGSGSKYYLDNVYIYAAKEYSVTLADGTDVGKLYGIDGGDVAADIPNSDFYKIGYDFTVSPEKYPADTNTKIVISYSPKENLASYVDFGADYAKTNQNRYFPAVEDFVIREDQKIEFKPCENTTPFAQRAVLLCNDDSESTVEPGKKYRITLKMVTMDKITQNTNDTEIITNYTIELKFGSALDGSMSASEAIFKDKALSAAVKSEKKQADGSYLYLLDLDVTVPETGWGSGSKQILASVCGKTSSYLDVAVIRSFFSYNVEDIDGNALGTISGFPGDSVSQALIGSEFIRADFTCEPATEDVFPETPLETVVLRYTEITNILEFIDFGDSYAAKHRSGQIPAWQYIGGETSYIAFGDHQIMFKGDINSGKSYGDRSVLLTNDQTTTVIKTGRRYQLQFDLLLKNETLSSKNIDIRFGNDVWHDSAYLVKKASELTLVKSEYKEPYTVYTLSVMLVAPADNNILISIYGNGASAASILQNVIIFEEFAYTCLDDNGDPAGKLYAFPGEEIADLLKGSEVDKPGFFETADLAVAPKKQSQTVTIHYEPDVSFVSYIDFDASYAPNNKDNYYYESGGIMTLNRNAKNVTVASNNKKASDEFKSRCVLLANDYKASGLIAGTSYLITFDLTVNSDFNISKYNVEFRSARYKGNGLNGTSKVYAGKELVDHVVEKTTVAGTTTYTVALGYDLASEGWGSGTERNILMSLFGGSNACTIDHVEISLSSKVKLNNTDLPDLVGKIGYPFSMPEDYWKKGYVFVGWYADADFQDPFTQETFPQTDTNAYARFQAVDTETEMDFTAAPPETANLTSFSHNVSDGNLVTASDNGGMAYLNLYKNANVIRLSPANYYPVTFRYKTAGYSGKLKVGLASATKNNFSKAQNILTSMTVSSSGEWKTVGFCATPEILTEDGEKGDYLYFFLEFEQSAGGRIYIDDIVLCQETTVLFQTSGGNDIEKMSGEPGTEFSLPTPVKTGSNFTGWYYDKALTKKVSGSKISYPTATKEMTLYASWDKAETAVTDEGFENYENNEIVGTANDSAKEVFSVSNSRAHNGNASMRYRFDPKSNTSITLQRSAFKLKGNSGNSGNGITVGKNTVYVMSFYVYAKALDTTVDFTAFTASGNNVLQNGVQVTASVGNARISPKLFPKNEWKKVYYVFTAGQKVSDADELFLSVKANSTTTYTEIYLDDVSVKPLAEDMGAVAFNTSVYSATLVELEYNYTVGKIGDPVVFPQALRNRYLLEGWYADYRYEKQFDPLFVAGVKAVYPQWDIDGTITVSLENASDYSQDGSGTGINKYTNHGGGKVVVGEQSSDGVAAYKYDGAESRDWQKVLALKETDGSPFRLVDGKSYVILVDIYLERYGSDFSFNFSTASQDNYYAWNGSTTGSIIVNADTPTGVWITTALTINAQFAQPGGFNLFLRHNASAGKTVVYFDNFRISSIDPEKPMILINKGLIGGSVDVISGNVGEAYQLPENVYVEGYDFAGWYSSPSLTRPVDFEGVFFETMTVYAKMLPKEFLNDFESGSDTFSSTKGGDMDYELYNKNDPGHSAANVHGGNVSLHRKGADYQNKNALIVRKNATLYPGEAYELSMWVKMDAYDHTNGAIKIASSSSSTFAWDLVGDMRAIVPIADLTDGEWHYVTYRFMASAYYLALQTPGYCSIYIDDISVKHLLSPSISDSPSFVEYIPIEKNADGTIPAVSEVAPETIRDDSLQIYEDYQKLLDEYNNYLESDYDEDGASEKNRSSNAINRIKKKKTTVTQKRNPLTFFDILTCNSYVWYTVVFYSVAGGVLLLAGGTVFLIVLLKKKKKKEKAAGGEKQ